MDKTKWLGLNTEYVLLFTRMFTRTRYFNRRQRERVTTSPSPAWLLTASSLRNATSSKASDCDVFGQLRTSVPHSGCRSPGPLATPDDGSTGRRGLKYMWSVSSWYARRRVQCVRDGRLRRGWGGMTSCNMILLFRLSQKSGVWQLDRRNRRMSKLSVASNIYTLNMGDGKARFDWRNMAMLN